MTAHAIRAMPPRSVTMRGSEVLTMLDSMTASAITVISPPSASRRFSGRAAISGEGMALSVMDGL